MRKKILVVDDSEVVLGVMQMILATEPYDVLTASDGWEALVRARVHRPDLIVMDRVIPGLDGLGVLRRLRRDPLMRDVPIVMQSVRTTPLEVAEALALGCNAYLPKPIDSARFVATIRACLAAAAVPTPGSA